MDVGWKLFLEVPVDTREYSGVHHGCQRSLILHFSGCWVTLTCSRSPELPFSIFGMKSGLVLTFKKLFDVTCFLSSLPNTYQLQ